MATASPGGAIRSASSGVARLPRLILLGTQRASRPAPHRHQPSGSQGSRQAAGWATVGSLRTSQALVTREPHEAQRTSSNFGTRQGQPGTGKKLGHFWGVVQSSLAGGIRAGAGGKPRWGTGVWPQRCDGDILEITGHELRSSGRCHYLGPDNPNSSGQDRTFDAPDIPRPKPWEVTDRQVRHVSSQPITR